MVYTNTRRKEVNEIADTKWSYSRVDTFKSCPRRYQYRYINGYRTIPDQAPDNALYLGTALHLGLEKGVEAAIDSYKSHYYMLTTEHYNEIIKLEQLIPKAKALIPDGQFELKVDAKGYIGYIDLIYQDWIIDFKYSNNRDNYLKSPQIHLYKYFVDRPINRLSYLFIPKIGIRQKKTETIREFRERLYQELEYAEPELVDVKYDQEKVEKWLKGVELASTAVAFPKNQSNLCHWCNYEEFCLKGQDWIIDPK